MNIMIDVQLHAYVIVKYFFNDLFTLSIRGVYLNFGLESKFKKKLNEKLKCKKNVDRK